MYMLGHNSLRYVLLYKQLSKARSYGREEYIVKEAKTKKQAKKTLNTA